MPHSLTGQNGALFPEQRHQPLSQGLDCGQCLPIVTAIRWVEVQNSFSGAKTVRRTIKKDSQAGLFVLGQILAFNGRSCLEGEASTLCSPWPAEQEGSFSFGRDEGWAKPGVQCYKTELLGGQTANNPKIDACGSLRLRLQRSSTF